MKSIILLLSLTLFFASSAFSQIVINKENFPMKASYFSEGYTSIQSAIQAPSSGENQTWDVTNLQELTSFLYEFNDATEDSFYENAINSNRVDYFFDIYTIVSRDFYAVDEQGYAKIGRRIAETTYPITALTGGADDLLKFVDGDFPFEGRSDYLKFPVEYGKTWTDSHSVPTNYELTIAAYGLNNAPGKYIRVETHSREVVGSGKLRMPNKDGGEMTIDALLIKEDISTLDSIFLGGQPAPPQLISAFGLEQGAVSSRVTYSFYSPGYGESVAYYDIEGESITYQSLSEIVSSVETEDLNTLNVYPNPVKIGSTLTIENIKNNITSVKLIDQTGKAVYTSKLTNANSIFTVDLPNTLTTGVYLLKSNNRKGELVNTSKIVIE